MDSKQLVPELRFPEFGGDWKESKIEEHFEFKNGLNKGGEFFGKGNPIINFMDVYKLSSIKKDDINGLVELSDSEIERYSVKKGDVFFTRTSETIIDIGMSATLIESIENCVFSGFVLRARPTDDLLEPIFTSYCFSISPIRKEITTKSSMTTRALTSGTNLNKVIFRFPKSLKEQQKIANFLTAIDQRITLLKEKKSALEHYKKGLMQKIFSQEIRFKDDEGNDFPEWENTSLESISEIYQPKTISQNQLSKKGYLVYGANGIIGFYHDYNHELEQVTVTCRGNTCGTVGLTKPKSWITGNAMVINLDDKDNESKKFYFYLLTFTDLRYLITGSGQPQITGDIKKHIIQRPIFEEQQKIANFLSAIDQKTNAMDKQITDSELFKKGLLQRMFV